jgi:hypothetical protein
MHWIYGEDGGSSRFCAIEIEELAQAGASPCRHRHMIPRIDGCRARSGARSDKSEL